jgi:hypothetical protein
MRLQFRALFAMHLRLHFDVLFDKSAWQDLDRPD